MSERTEDPSPETDEALVAAYTAENAEAFAQLYDRHARATWRFIRHRLGPANEMAADVVLENSWIDAAQQAPGIPGRWQWTPWLYTLVRRHVLAFLAAPGAGPDESAVAHPGPPPSAPKARARHVLSTVAALPAPVREALVLHLEAGLGASGIAAVTGAPIDEIHARLHTGIARLAAVAAVAEGDREGVAQAYVHAWSLRDAISRGPSEHARESALAAARAVLGLRREAAAEAPAPGPHAPGIAQVQIDFATAVDAALESALRDATMHAPAPRESMLLRAVQRAGKAEAAAPVDGTAHETPQAPAAGSPTPRDAAAIPANAPGPTPGPGAMPAGQAQDSPHDRRSPASNGPSWLLRGAAAGFIALVAGIAGWQVRDKFGPHVAGVLFDPPITASADRAGAEPSRQRVDEALARADAALGHVPAPAAERPPVTGADATSTTPPVASMPTNDLPRTASQTGLIASAPASAIAQAALPRVVARDAWSDAPAIRAAAADAPASTSQEMYRNTTLMGPPAPHSPVDTRIAARPTTPPIVSQAPPRAPVASARRVTVAVRPQPANLHDTARTKQDVAAAIKAAQARADAFLAGASGPSPSR